jgi:hypothetical protein
MTEWKWFVGKTKEKEINKKPIDNDYYKLAKDPIPALTKDPELLFKVVDFTTDECMCGGSCGSCCQETSDVYFIDLIIQYKSIKESDLVKLPKLNWFKITSHLPLSIPTLERYVDKVDWKYISSSYLYKKNNEFIRKFHKHLDMKSVYNIDVTEDEACNLVFDDKILPLHTIKNIPMNLILCKVKGDAEYIGSSIENTTYFIRMFGAKETEETFLKTSGALKIDSKGYVDKCCSDKYIPKNKRFIDILKKGVTYWHEFMICCKPDIEFIETHIVPGASENTWHDISEYPKLTTAFIEKYITHLNMRKVSQHYQFNTVTLKKILGNWNTEYGSLSIYTRLTPEFIDEYADKLDWFNLCEHQVLPEWLLNKHKDKLNWGQVSMYQNLSQTFIDENRNMLNMIKLSQNKAMSSKSLPFML